MYHFLLNLLSKLPLGLVEVPTDDEPLLGKSRPVKGAQGTMAYYGQSLLLTPSEARIAMFQWWCIGMAVSCAILLPTLAYIDKMNGR